MAGRQAGRQAADMGAGTIFLAFEGSRVQARRRALKQMQDRSTPLSSLLVFPENRTRLMMLPVSSPPATFLLKSLWRQT